MDDISCIKKLPKKRNKGYITPIICLLFGISPRIFIYLLNSLRPCGKQIPVIVYFALVSALGLVGD
jgi:hypothetical protein